MQLATRQIPSGFLAFVCAIIPAGKASSIMPPFLVLLPPFPVFTLDLVPTPSSAVLPLGESFPVPGTHSKLMPSSLALAILAAWIYFPLPHQPD